MSTKKITQSVNFSTFYERIKDFEDFKKDKDLAILLGISPAAVGNYRSRGEIPVTIIAKYALEKNRSVDYLIGIKGAKKTGLTTEDLQNCCDLAIPYLDLLEREQITRTVLDLKKEWLLAEFPEEREFISGFCMDADNMTPTINLRDFMLINRKLNSLSGAGIYALRQGAVIMIRRVFVGIDGSYTFKNDNEVYPPEKITAAQMAALNLEVLGRVIWSGKKV